MNNQANADPNSSYGAATQAKTNQQTKQLNQFGIFGGGKQTSNQTQYSDQQFENALQDAEFSEVSGGFGNTAVAATSANSSSWMSEAANALYAVSNAASFGLIGEVAKLEGTAGLFNTHSAAYQNAAIATNVAMVLAPGLDAAIAVRSLLAAGDIGFFKSVGISLWESSSEETHQLANITRVSSNIANRPFVSEEAIAAGWNPPYPADISIRQITTGNEIQFYRFFTGDKLLGRFLVRPEEVAEILNQPEQLRIYLGLKEIPTNMADVYVSANTNLLVGRIGPQPEFGLFENSGFQYQLLDEIPKQNFQNVRPILQNNNVYNPISG